MTELYLYSRLLLYFFLFLDYAAVGIDEEETLPIKHSGGWAKHILRHTGYDFVSLAFLLNFVIHLSSLLFLIFILLPILIILCILEIYFLAVLHLLNIHSLHLFDLSFVCIELPITTCSKESAD